MMFPKFFRVTPVRVYKYPIRINESTVIYAKRPFLHATQQLDTLAKALGFSYEVVYPEDEVHIVQRLPNKTWIGPMGMLYRGEADLVFGDFSMDDTLNEDFHLSFPHSISGITFVTKKPVHVPDPAVFLHPFSIHVWLSIIACVCLVPFMFHYLLRRKRSALNVFTSTVVPLVGQGINLIPKRLREYFALASWILGSALLYYFYAAVLLSFITMPSLHGVRTIDDLANGIRDGEYQCGMNPYATYDDHFSDISIPSFKVIGDNLRQNKRKEIDYFVTYLDTSSDGKKPAFVGVRADFQPFREQYFVSEEDFYSIGLVIAMRKDFCCASKVDRAIHRVWASGILKRFEARRYHITLFYNLRTYGKYWSSPPSEYPLTMTMLKGPFIFLIVSHSLAIVVFLIELIIGKLKNRKLQKFGFLKRVTD